MQITKKRTLLGAVMAAAALVLTACSGGAAVSRVDATAFADAVATQGTVVLDVRTPAEFAAGHLENAINIDVESGTFEADIAALDPAKTYAVYCRSGNRSQTATALMTDAGFTSIFELDGGIGAWMAAGLPVVV